MKSFVVALVTSVYGPLAMANPFDFFVGNYVVNGYHQSHILHFQFNDGSIGEGWMGFPIADFNDSVQGGGFDYAKTTGDSNMAQNVSGDSFLQFGSERWSDTPSISLMPIMGQRIWFKRKKYGWGWTPANAAGWA